MITGSARISQLHAVPHVPVSDKRKQCAVAQAYGRTSHTVQLSGSPSQNRVWKSAICCGSSDVSAAHSIPRSHDEMATHRWSDATSCTNLRFATCKGHTRAVSAMDRIMLDSELLVVDQLGEHPYASLRGVSGPCDWVSISARSTPCDSAPSCSRIKRQLGFDRTTRLR